MTKYTWKANEKTFRFDLMEKDSGNVIGSSLFPDICKKYLDRLNKGTAFDGRTPVFFCNPELNLD